MLLRFLQELNSHDANYHDDHFHDDHYDFANNTIASSMMEDSAADMHEDDHDGKPWREVFFATFLINLVTLSGVILVAFSVFFPRYRDVFTVPSRAEAQQGDGQRRLPLTSHVLDRLVIPSFAAGALLATSVFLIIPESIELIGGGHEGHEEHNHRFLEEVDHQGHDHGSELVSDYTHAEVGAESEEDIHKAVAWKFGCAILGGFLLPFLLGTIFAPPHKPEEVCETCEEHEGQLIRSAAANTILQEDKNEMESTVKPCCDKHKMCAAKDEQITTTASVVTFDDSKHYENVIDVDDLHNKDDTKIVSADEENNAVADLAEDAKEDTCCDDDHCNANTSAPQVEAAKNKYNYQLIGCIILGDFCHNFCDGIFVGNAFLFCERQVAYAIVAATLYHELAQEFADFCLLTRHCGLRVVPALVLNFVSGLSVMLGAFVILMLDFSNQAMGVTLAVSAGVYIYIAASECLPRVLEHDENKTVKNRMIFMLCFAVGVVPIGLVLINHSHGC